jgi:hypothetical protein
MSEQCITNEKNISLSSINVKNTLEHVKFLTEIEKKIVTKMIEKSKLGKHGHDLTQWFDWANGSLGYLIDRCGESVRLGKEGLQARGIILIDGLTWDQQQREIDGRLVRDKTPYNQRIQFTKSFVTWFGSCVEARKILSTSQWGYCDRYVIKTEMSKMKAKLSKLKYSAGIVRQVCISMGKTCEEVTRELVRGVTKSLGTFTKTQELKFNTEDNSRIGCYLLSQEKDALKNKFVNPLLANLSSYTHKKVKIWTDATTRICKQLLDSGMTKVEVARSMIHQSYVNSVIEFEEKYSPPIVF